MRKNTRELLSQRWQMLNNPHVDVVEFTEFSAADFIQHSFDYARIFEPTLDQPVLTDNFLNEVRCFFDEQLGDGVFAATDRYLRRKRGTHE